MQLTKIEKNGITCAIVNGSEPVIIDAQTALDVLMSAKYDIGTKNIVIDKKLIVEDFFILSKGLAVMDSTAASLCRDNDIPLLVFNLQQPENMVKAVLGENVGTVVVSEK